MRLLLVVTYWDCNCFGNSTPWSRYWDLDTHKQKDPPEVLCFVLWQIHLGTTILCQVSHIKNSEGTIVVFFYFFYIPNKSHIVLIPWLFYSSDLLILLRLHLPTKMTKGLPVWLNQISYGTHKTSKKRWKHPQIL